MGQPKSDFEQVIRDAESAFWEEIAKRCPEATSGDLPPEVAMPFLEACRDAACQWYAINVPDTASKTVLRVVTVTMRPPRSGERGWWVKADDAEGALAEVLRESENLGFIAQKDVPAALDEHGMRAITVDLDWEG